MNFLSVSSGISAASVAWGPLGMKACAFSEIEPFPCAVLAHHYPSTPNLGDMTLFHEWPDTLRPDILEGGTPCQAFSVAGLRKGLADPRGNLCLTFLGIAERNGPRWLVWENVPGVFSATSHDAPDPCPPADPMDLELDGQTLDVTDDYDADEVHALHCFLAGLSELGYGWAYRVLDAQHFGVPQRRRRIFVVAYLGDWRPAAAVLFERESLRGDSPPSRATGEGIAGTITSRAGNSSRPAGANGNLAVDYTNGSITGDVVGTLEAAQDKGNRGHGIIAPAVTSKWAKGSGDECQNLVCQDVTHALRGEGFDASEDGTGRGTPIVPVAFDCKASGRNGFAVGELSPTLRAMGHKSTHQNAGGQVAIAFDTTQITSPENRSNPQPGNPCHPLFAGAHAPAVAFNLRGREGGAMPEVDPDGLACQRAASGGSSRSYVATTAVRRLTPRECERLQGFPDDYTLIPWRGGVSPDGPRYKALGNSMAVPVMRWIGERILMVSALIGKESA